MKIKKLIAVPAGLAITGISLGIIGSNLNNASISKAGEISNSFISPAISLTAGGILIKQLKDINKKTKKAF
jgi:hypothetical protein